MPTDRADLNLRILHPLLRFLADEHGTEARDEILAAAALAPRDLDGSRWVGWEQFELLLRLARERMPDDETFLRACVYRFSDGYGPLRFLIWAVSPVTIYELSGRTASAIVRIGTLAVERKSPNRVVCRYRSMKPESRLMTLSRVAQMAAMPTIWGLPKADVTLTNCIADGAEFDEYDIRLYYSRRWTPLLLGTLLGVAAALPLALFWAWSPLLLLLPALGLSVAFGLESMRTNRVNLELANEHAAALRQLARDDAEARQELIEMHRRQRDWSRMLEERVGEQQHLGEQVLERMQQLAESRQKTLVGVSHDIRNPLLYLKMAPELLRRPHDPSELEEVLEEHADSVQRIEKLIKDLMGVVASDTGLVQLHPVTLDVRTVGERLRARLRALNYGRQISSMVLCTREAPASIVTDHAVFDRVIDNLLSNAARYTQEGSVLVELDGRPGYLTVKVSDTGHGISADALEAIFSPQRKPGSGGRGYGVGLSVVVRLMAQLGGKLEVMSRPGAGTTFWAHFPEALVAQTLPRDEELVGKVVTIRSTR